MNDVDPNNRTDLHRFMRVIDKLNPRRAGDNPRPTARAFASELDITSDQALEVVITLETLGWVEHIAEAPRRGGHDHKWWRLTPSGAEQLLKG